MATSATEGPPPPSVIERPIAGKRFPILIRDCHLSFKADVWLSLDESRMIEHDLILLGNPFPCISLIFSDGDLRTEQFFFKLLGEAIAWAVFVLLRNRVRVYSFGHGRQEWFFDHNALLMTSALRAIPLSA